MRAIYRLPLFYWQWCVQETEETGEKYRTLLEVTVGQEEVEDIIRRDIHRTFPQHPQFLLGQGQEELFNLLKAYSLTDMPVGYCQGMGFLAGILLMYMPEHLAFELFSTLMSRGGPNLRRFYLDGMIDLKHEMAKFEWLLARHHPKLAGHLQEHCIPCVLYVSQWLLTVFACPFPAFFTAQLVDIMLLENSDRIVMQVRCASSICSVLSVENLLISHGWRICEIFHASLQSRRADMYMNGCMLQTCMAIMAEVEERILRTDNFEDIITCLKSDPAQWSDDKLRGLLTAAYLSSVSEEELKLASDSVGTTEPSGFSRRGSQVSQPGSALDGVDDRVGESSQAGTQAGDSNAGRKPEKAASVGQLDEFEDIMKQELEQLQWAGPSASLASLPAAPLGDALDAKSLLRLSGDVGAGRDAEEPSRIDLENTAESTAPESQTPPVAGTSDSVAPQPNRPEPPFPLGDDGTK